MQLIEFQRFDDHPFFSSLRDRRALLCAARRLADRRGVQLHGWLLDSHRFIVLVAGQARLWRRLVQSSYGVQAYYDERSRPLWAPPVQVPVEDLDFALGVLHGSRSPWSSLWEHLGLRDWGALPDGLERSRLELARHAGLAVCPEPWRGGLELRGLAEVALALEFVTGEPVSRRGQSVSYAQLAWRCGWAERAIGLSRGRSASAVRKALNQPPRREVERAAAWLRPPLAPILARAQLRPSVVKSSSISNRRIL